MSKEEKELLAKVVESVIELHGKIKSMKGKKTAEVMQIIAEILPDVLKKVEELGDELGSADKKELAIEACLKYCNIKCMPDALERKLIGFMIDGSISMLNKWFGKDWLKKIGDTATSTWKWLKKLFGRE